MSESDTVQMRERIKTLKAEKRREKALRHDAERYQQAAEDRLNPVMIENEKLTKALQSIRQVLGPKAGCGDCCEGCQYEMQAALDTANDALVSINTVSDRLTTDRRIH